MTFSSVDTAFDCRVRYHLRTLFQKIWGGGKVQLGNKSALVERYYTLVTDTHIEFGCPFIKAESSTKT